MPEKCLYCGEEAVIEECVDDGREQMICIECGSLATGNIGNINSQVEDPDDILDSDEADTLASWQGPDDASVRANCDRVCLSCGVCLGVSTAASICLECDAVRKSSTIAATTEETGNDAQRVVQVQSQEDGSLCPNFCSACGSKNLSVDSMGADERLVCTDCGAVNSECVLTSSTFAPDGYTQSRYFVPALPQFAERKRVAHGITAGLTRISHLCSRFYFPSAVQTEAEDMYKALFYHPKVLRKTIVMKEHVAAMCLFIVCRQRDFPISLTRFKSEVSDFLKFLRVKKHVLKTLKIVLPPMSMTSQITEVFDRLNFDLATMEKLKDILFLFRRAWLVEGYPRIGLLTLAAYYAYLSSGAEYLTVPEFCTMKKFPQPSAKMSVNCYRFLLRLARSLPWVSLKKVQRRTLHTYIDSVLQYQHSLFHLIFNVDDNTEEVSRLATSPAFSPLDSASEKSGMRRAPKRDLCLSKDKLLPACCKIQKSLVKVEESVPMPIPDNIDLDCPVLREDEFDDEISSYILSKEEQKSVRQGKLNSMTK